MSDSHSRGDVAADNSGADVETERRPVGRTPVVSAVSFLLGIALTLAIYPLATAPKDLSGVPTYDGEMNVVEETDLPDSEISEDENSPPEEAESSEPTVQYRARALQSALDAGTESGFPEELLENAVDLATMMRPSVVQVFGKGQDFETGTGTGWLVAPDVIATNDHVIDFEGADAEITIRTLDGKELSGELISSDPDGDIAFVRLPEIIEAPIFRVSRTRVEVGEPVIAVGHPHMIGNWETMAGVVASVPEFRLLGSDREFVDVNTSLPTSQGSSGSPIMRMDGVVVAINSRKVAYDEDSGASSEDVFVHTFIPRAENNGGSASEVLIAFAEQSGVELLVVD